MSDHNPISFNVTETVNSKCSTKYTFKRSFNDDNINSFVNLIKSETWDDVYAEESGDDKYNSFLNIFLYYFNMAFPKQRKSINIRNSKCWIPSEIKEWSVYIRDLYLLHKNTNCENVLNLYKTEKKNYKLYIRDYKIQVNNNKISNAENKSKATWDIFNKYVNLKKKNSQSQNELLISDDQNNKITDPEILVNLFSEQFSLSPSRPVGQRNSIISQNHQSLFFNPASAQEITNVVLAMPNKKSSGLDEIPISIIKKVVFEIAEPLSEVINKCIQQGIFPVKLKVSKTIPIHKNGCRENIENYRGISVPPCFSKIMETIIYIRMI